ncbi:MAG: alpha/beta fold hydrolase [Micropruina sp.]
MTVMPGAEAYFHDGGEIGVLVCHGYCGSPQGVRPWAEYLAAQGYTVSLPRLPGMGTDWHELQRTTWQDWYGEVDRAYADLASRCRTVFAVGLSMGGLLATKIALDHPELAGLVVVNPIYKHNNPALPLLPALRWVLPTLPGIVGDIKKPGQIELGYDRNPLQAMYSQTQLWKLVRDELGNLTQPVLLLTSAEDHVVPPVSWQYLVEHHASDDFTHQVLANSYHVATLDNDAPLIFAESVRFIERLAPNQATG